MHFSFSLTSVAEALRDFAIPHGQSVGRALAAHAVGRSAIPSVTASNFLAREKNDGFPSHAGPKVDGDGIHPCSRAARPRDG